MSLARVRESTSSWCTFARPQAYSRGTAERDGAVVALIRRPLGHEQFLKLRHVIQRAHSRVLIISLNHQDIGRRGAGSSQHSSSQARQGKARGHLER